jgi:hypothetical protein
MPDRQLPNPCHRAKSTPSNRRTSASPHPITSPILSALGSATNTAAQYTSDWARSLPPFNGNPSNLASSPPVLSLGVRDASTPHISVSPSPPNMRPQSHPNQYQSFGGRQRIPHRDRRSSTLSRGQTPLGSRAPLPHEDQAHFHPGGLPDLDSFGAPISSGGLSPGERGYCCTFDSLSTAGHGPSVSAENVLIVGWEGGFRVQRITRKTIDIIGSIEGLRGGVHAAKILPWSFRSDPGSAGRPYIAVIVHGPVISEEPISSNTSEGMSQEDQDGGSDPSAQIPYGNAPEMSDVVKKYQTTVEIYSLSSRKHIATVFKTPTVEVDYSPVGDFKPPPPIGDLRLDANGKHLVVSSGISGEVFVFSPFTRDQTVHELESIRCIGKFWTSIQRRELKLSASVSAGGEQLPITEEAETVLGTPLLSLSHRWLAIVPPSADSLFSMKGKASLLHDSSRPPGITTHVAPPKPSTNCSVEMPEGESLMDKVSREVTQRALKGAQWIGQHGMQAWNTYFNRAPAGNNAQNAYYAEPSTQPAFPPTHGLQNSTTSESPTQVAIYDLQRLLDYEEIKIKNALHPLATFEPPSGCSFLSFAPNGLTLLSISRKGDQKFVWNLMRLQYPRQGIGRDQDLGPHVRLVARFTRMTSAITVDVVWSAPQGERFALLTDKGTIHVHELPSSALSWPLRRLRRSKFSPSPENRGDQDASATKGAVESAMSAANGAGAWIRSAVRPKSVGNTSSFSTNLMMTPAATANAGGKVVKDGLSKGVKLVANSANTIYHASENKLHMGVVINGATPGSMRWMTGKDRGYLAILVTGTVNIYAVRQVAEPRKGMPPLIRAKISKKPTEFALQKISDEQFAPAFRAIIEAKFNLSATKETPHLTGFWYLRTPSPHSNLAPIPQIIRPQNWHALVEAETNPPYQPFHTDRRVALFAFTDPDPQSTPRSSQNLLGDSQVAMDARNEYTADVLAPWLHEAHHVDPDTIGLETWPVDAPEPWLFGLEIPAARVLTGGRPGGGAVSETMTGAGAWSDDEDAVENRVTVVEGEEGEQVLVTTVIRRGTGRDEEGEFFEDGAEFVDFADDRV